MKTFLNGIKVAGPLFFVILILFWLVSLIDTFGKWVLLMWLPEDSYFKGLGFLITLLVIFLIGVLMRLPSIRSVHKNYESYLMRLPFVKTVFNMAKNFLNFFSSVKKGKVVAVKTEMGRIIGIMTRENFSDLPQGYVEEGQVAVYLPMSYQIGGYTLMVSRDRVIPLDLSIEDALGLIMTASITSDPEKEI